MPPFEAAIEAGVDSIMTAHIKVPSLDPTGYPATVSKPIMTGLLRDELNFRGVIVTDALGMGGANVFPAEEIPVMVLEAGVDQLLMPPDLPLALNAVKAAVESGRLSERRIDQSLLRILLLKLKRGILTSPFVDLDKVDDKVGTPASIKTVDARTSRKYYARNSRHNLTCEVHYVIASAFERLGQRNSSLRSGGLRSATTIPD